MKRRQAIRQIAVVSSGLVLLPSCNFQSGTAFKTYKHLSLQKNQYRLIDALQNAILPTENMPVNVGETPLNYMLTKINDCYSMEDIEKYLTGLKNFEERVQNSRFGKAFEKLSPEKQIQVLNEGFPDKTTSSSAQKFLETTKKLTVEYFTQSEEYQVNHFGFEFMPSRYSGCVQI